MLSKSFENTNAIHIARDGRRESTQVPSNLYIPPIELLVSYLQCWLGFDVCLYEVSLQIVDLMYPPCVSSLVVGTIIVHRVQDASRTQCQVLIQLHLQLLSLPHLFLHLFLKPQTGRPVHT